MNSYITVNRTGKSIHIELHQHGLCKTNNKIVIQYTAY